jgi:hypothetical protein
MELTWFPRRSLNYIQGSDCAATGTRVGERPRFSGSVPHLPQQAHREAAAAHAWTAAGVVAPSETARSLRQRCVRRAGRRFTNAGRLVGRRSRCAPAPGLEAAGHPRRRDLRHSREADTRATKPCFFAPRTRIGFGFPAGAAFSQNLNI